MLDTKQASDRAERVQLGRRARQVLPRRSLAGFPGAKLRRNPISVMQAADEQRLERLLPVKYARMLLSPFAFFRGSVAVMASDLSLVPHAECLVQLCGDAHVQNLGWYETP